MLIMIKAAKMGLQGRSRCRAGAEQKQGRSRAGAEKEQGKSGTGARVGAGTRQEQGRKQGTGQGRSRS